jgi:hypothetical protein
VTPESEIQRFITTGEHDVLHGAWAGHDFFTRAHTADRTLRTALADEVRRRTITQSPPSLPPGSQAGPFVLRKVAPMVQGLFPANERQAMLDLFEKSLCFVTHENIDQLLSETIWLSTARQLTNLYLGSLGLPGLNDQPVDFVGFSEETNLYCSMAYFQDQDPFADWVVHEAAHVFHNWKRNRVGLHSTRTREFLLDIAFAKRELFAYACEAYSRILEQAKRPVTKRQMLAEYIENHVPSCEGLDRAELVSILTDAVAARNGWKQILRRCMGQAEP